MASDRPSDPLRPHSSVVVDGNDRAPARSMLRAVGFTDEDFRKPQIAVASAASDGRRAARFMDRVRALR